MGLLPYHQTKDLDLNKLQTIWMSILNPAIQSVASLLGLTSTQGTNISTLQGQVSTIQSQITALQGQTALIPIMSNWTSYTLTIGAVTTAPTPGTTSINQALWRRVGDSMQLQYTFVQTAAGSAGSGIYLFPIPTGRTIDTTKVTVGTNRTVATNVGVGYASSSQHSSDDNSTEVSCYNTTNLAMSVSLGSSGSTVISSSGDFSLSSSAITFTFIATVPIVGWSVYGP